MNEIMLRMDPATTPRGKWRMVRNVCGAIAVVATSFLTAGVALPIWAATGLTLAAAGSTALGGFAWLQKGDKEVKEVTAKKAARLEKKEEKKAGKETS